MAGEWIPNSGGITLQPGDRVQCPDKQMGTVIIIDEPTLEEDGTQTFWTRVKKDDGQIVQAPTDALRFLEGLEGIATDTLPEHWGKTPQHPRKAASEASGSSAVEGWGTDINLSDEGLRTAYNRFGMAERTGDPELDTLIEEYVGVLRRQQKNLQDPQWAAGACMHESEKFAEWLIAHGVDAQTSGDRSTNDDPGIGINDGWTEDYVSPEDFGYTDRSKQGFNNHVAVLVWKDDQEYMIDWTAAQYGYGEYPMVQRLKEPWSLSGPNEWQRKWASMIRLGASVEELAKETIEDILGYQGEPPMPGTDQIGQTPMYEEPSPEEKKGHKPPRADIQKMKDVYNLWRRGRTQPGQQPPEMLEMADAQREWQDKYTLNEREQGLLYLYLYVLKGASQPDDPFRATIDLLAGGAEMDSQRQFVPGLKERAKNPNPDALKKELGTALKKYEQQHYPQMYTTIEGSLQHAQPEGYKLFPRLVSWLKDDFKDWMLHANTVPNKLDHNPKNINDGPGERGHYLDIVDEGGRILSQLRQENRLPQGMDVNQMGFKDFEEWLMQWKRDNREAEAQGEVVYEFKDGYTMQRLTTPEQLQFEGDEMGHCVGGYTYQVADGTSVIYSLRDAKGQPHATMEIEGLYGHPPDPNYQNDNYPTFKSYWSLDAEYFAPHNVPEEIWTESDGFVPSQKNPDPEASQKLFQVRQIMGKSDDKPKPEYQRKIKEFLDSLRGQGIQFADDDFIYPNDDYGNERDTHFTHDHREHYMVGQQWDTWEEHYRHNPGEYTGQGEGNAYGLPGGDIQITVDDMDKYLDAVLYSMVDEYDRSMWRNSNPERFAQEFYHWYILQAWGDRKGTTHTDADVQARIKQDFLDHIQQMEEMLQDWAFQDLDNLPADEYHKKYEELHGEVPEDQQHWTGGDMHSYLSEIDFDENDPWYAAEQGVRDEHFEWKYGNAMKFCNYLYHLVEGGPGALKPDELPDPIDYNRGLPTLEELQDGSWAKANRPEQSGTIAIPGTLSSRIAMADRSSIPQIDQLIEDFLREPQGEWTTDSDPIENLRDPARAAGACEEVTSQFVEFAKQRGLKAYVTRTDLDELGYETTGEPQGDVLNEQGEIVPGFYDEHTVAEIYLPDSRFPVTIDFTATQYGYSDHPKVLSAWNAKTETRLDKPLLGLYTSNMSQVTKKDWMKTGKTVVLQCTPALVLLKDK